MKYTIVIDKQPRTNPSGEKKEIEITLDHPLLKKGEVRDELIIQNKICKVIRNLNLNDDNSITVLNEPYEELIGDVDIELFLGDNYIYIKDEDYMEIYIKYLTHNDLNDAYATKMDLSSSITQTATSIMLEVNKKTDKGEIISTINQSAEEITIKANKIGLEGYTTINDGFSIDEDGNMTCNNATINGGKIDLKSENYGNRQSVFKISNNGDEVYTYIYPDGYEMSDRLSVGDDNAHFLLMALGATTREPGITLSKNGNDLSSCDIDRKKIFLFTNLSETEITANAITTPVLHQTSLEEKKKNFEQFSNAIDIIKNTDVYKYNLKFEDDTDKKHIGLVIGKKYKTPKEFISKDGQAIELYSMTSICLQAIKELNEKVETLERRIKELEVKSNE